MIPKVIHYCWFGNNEKSKLALKCIDSWKKYCPDYKVIEWNEDNFDINYNGYTRYCYNNKKWAFLSDFVRLVIIAEHGGIYFDTDVELLQNIDYLRRFDAFYGFEDDLHINTGEGFGTIAHHFVVERMKQLYLQIVPDKDGNYPLQSCPALNTLALKELGLNQNGRRQRIMGAEILPAEYMNPYDNPTGKLSKTVNTISVHWYAKSWISKKAILRSKLTKPFHRIFGANCFQNLRKKIYE